MKICDTPSSNTAESQERNTMNGLSETTRFPSRQESRRGIRLSAMKPLSGRISVLFISALIVLAVICTSIPAAGARTAEQDGTSGVSATAMKNDDGASVAIDFNDVDITVFIKFISEITKKNFVIDRAVRGKVTIIAPGKLSVKEAYKVFESVLDVHGYTAVPAGDIIKIIPAGDAKEKRIETRLKQEAIVPEDKIVTQIITLKYASPEEMEKVLTPLVSKSSVIISYPPTGMLIVTDLLSNIKRLMTIITALDVEGTEEQISVIPLKSASAAETAASISLIFQEATRTRKSSLAAPVKIVSDERTNTIITLASEIDTYRIKELINLLDRDVPKSEANVRVYRLQNADAEELTKVLMNLPSQNDQRQVKGKTSVPSKDRQIVPDKATNTLIITAGRDDYSVLESIIRQLDIPRPMVYIEALIMEVNIDKDFNIGAEWTAGDYISKGRTKIGAGSFRGDSSMISTTSSGGITLPKGFSVGILGEAISIGSLTFPSIGAIFNAYQKDKDVNILSTPQIMTLDNEDAEIYVGKNVPYQTRAETSSTDLDYSTYEYKDVGVTLKITPQISEERYVRLNIYQEVTKLADTDSTTDRPTTLKRTAKTAVSIKDTNTIVIGGLVGDDVTRTTYQVPCLGNMPLLGWLFKYRSERRERTNLFIFITPHIVESPVEAKALREEKEQHINKIKEGIVRKKTSR
jgi:general secretion pathway protein D